MSRYADHKEAKKKLNEISKNKEKYLIIHYSCESFFNTNGHSPHITAIAIKDLASNQTKLFSIHQIAEIDGIDFKDISKQYDSLEKKMLRDYYKYVKTNNGKIWIHWNMRNSNFGFGALDQRYKVLKGKPEEISDSEKLDLSNLLVKLYGKGYISNPRIPSLMKKNNINPKDFLNGEDEASAFENAEYVKLSFSTARKVDVFKDFLTQAIDGTLQVNSKGKEIYGGYFWGAYAYSQETSFGKTIVWLLNMIIGGIIGALISHFI